MQEPHFWLEAVEQVTRPERQFEIAVHAPYKVKVCRHVGSVRIPNETDTFHHARVYIVSGVHRAASVRATRARTCWSERR